MLDIAHAIHGLVANRIGLKLAATWTSVIAHHLYSLHSPGDMHHVRLGLLLVQGLLKAVGIK
jgi:hypothetical protein